LGLRGKLKTHMTTGKVYRRSFSGPVSQESGLGNPVGSPTFHVENDVRPAFEPYTGEVTIRGNSGALNVELLPMAGADQPVNDN